VLSICRIAWAKVGSLNAEKGVALAVLVVAML
jgi:hypothetical protein